jgi:hypothetical protein
MNLDGWRSFVDTGELFHHSLIAFHLQGEMTRELYIFIYFDFG